MNPVEAVFILAAGKGERLRPLTLNTPKPLLPISGRPILEHILERLVVLQPKRVVLNAWYLKDQIIDYARAASVRFPFDICVSSEDDLLGTGGGVKKALSFIQAPEFLMLNGDCLFEGNIKSFVEKAQSRSDCEAVWWLAPESSEQTKIGYSRGVIRQIGNLWNAGESEDYGCFSGIQWMNAVHRDLLPDKGCIVRQYWIPLLGSGKKLGADVNGLRSWTDIGTPERYQSLLVP
jgi:MurNAc alpha-1-phosphate uridylyltransferase